MNAGAPAATNGAGGAPSIPEPGAGLLDEVAVFIGRFVAFPSDGALAAVTLWVAHTHAVDAAESTPRIAYLSPEPSSGKTRALEVSELLVPSPMHAINATPAALFRAVHDLKARPTILFDEIDTVFGPKVKANEEVRGLLNAGHRRGAVAYRCVGEGTRQKVQGFPSFAAVALAGLGDLPDTLMTRSVVIRMRRRAPGEHVEPFRRRVHAEQGHQLRERLAAWTTTVAGELAGAWPVMPTGISDRPADVWEPLLAIADAAGGQWPARARAACLELVKAARSADSGSLGVRLLADLRHVFGDAVALSTETILQRLRGIEDAPWADLRGKALDPRGLAGRLKRYGVGPHQFRGRGGEKLRGYSVAGTDKAGGLGDPWSRYLFPSAGSGTSGTAGTRDDSGSSGHLPLVRDEPARTGTPTASGTDNGALNGGVPAVPDVPLPAERGTGARAVAPPRFCPAHRERPAEGPCRPCGDYRRAREEWDTEASRSAAAVAAADRRTAAERRAARIADCELCDDRGYTGVVLCDHDPHHPERAARGAAAVRAELDARRAQPGRALKRCQPPPGQRPLMNLVDGDAASHTPEAPALGPDTAASAAAMASTGRHCLPDPPQPLPERARGVTALLADVLARRRTASSPHTRGAPPQQAAQ